MVGPFVQTTSEEPPHILEEAERLIYGDREQDYGSPRKNFDDIATGWEVIFGTHITARQICWAMNWLKTCRDINGSPKRDNPVDAAGYLGLMERLDGI